MYITVKRKPKHGFTHTSTHTAIAIMNTMSQLKTESEYMKTPTQNNAYRVRK